MKSLKPIFRDESTCLQDEDGQRYLRMQLGGEILWYAPTRNGFSLLPDDTHAELDRLYEVCLIGEVRKLAS